MVIHYVTISVPITDLQIHLATKTVCKSQATLVVEDVDHGHTERCTPQFGEQGLVAQEAVAVCGHGQEPPYRKNHERCPTGPQLRHRHLETDENWQLICQLCYFI